MAGKYEAAGLPLLRQADDEVGALTSEVARLNAALEAAQQGGGSGGPGDDGGGTPSDGGGSTPPDPTWQLVKELHPERGEGFADWRVSRQIEGTGTIEVGDWGGAIGRAIKFELRKGNRCEFHMQDKFPYGTHGRQTSEIFIPKPLNPNGWPVGSGEMVTEQSHADDSDPDSNSEYSPSSAIRQWRESDETWSVATKDSAGKIKRLGDHRLKGATNRWIRIVHEFRSHMSDGVIAFRVEELDGTLIDEVRFEGEQTAWGEYGFYWKVGGFYHGAGTMYRRNIRDERRAA